MFISGNSLHYGKDRDAQSVQSTPPSISDNIYDGLTDSLETSLMQNDVLNRHRNPPISYLQNRVNATAGELPPKVVNNPNGEAVGQHEPSTTPQHNQAVSRPKNKKVKELGFLGHLAILGKLAFGSKFEDNKQKREQSHSPVTRMENGVAYESIGQNNPLFEPSQGVETEIQMTNTGPVVRPASLSQGNEKQRGHGEQDLAVDEAKENKHERQSSSPMFSRLRGAPYSKSTSDLSPQKTSSSKLEKDIRLSRPSTLSLKGHNYHFCHRYPSSSLNSLPFFKNSVLKGPGGHRTLPNGYKLIKPPYPEPEPMEKIRSRVKTPLLEKKGRLSLYDDRLMTDMKEKDCAEVEEKMNKPNVSLQQFKVVETNPNQYVSADCTC